MNNSVHEKYPTQNPENNKLVDVYHEKYPTHNHENNQLVDAYLDEYTTNPNFDNGNVKIMEPRGRLSNLPPEQPEPQNSAAVNRLRMLKLLPLINKYWRR